MFLHSDYSQVRFHHRIWTKGLHHFGDYHEFNLEIEFVLSYIILEITLIHFQISHTQGSICILLRDLHYVLHSDYPQHGYPILNFEL